MIAAAAALLLGAAAPPSPGDATSPRRIVRVEPHSLWSSPAASIWVVRCTEGDGDLDQCAGLELRSGGTRRMLGQEYLVSANGLLWRARPGVAGPDALVFGSRGGSDGHVELFAVSQRGGSVRVQALAPDHTDEPEVVVRDGRAAFDARFSFGGLGVGGSNASTASVPVPVAWRGGRFQVDLTELRRRSLGPEDDDLREAASRQSLGDALDDAGAVRGDALQPAVQALAGLMLYGRADRARALLHAAWPKVAAGSPVVLTPAPGEQAFWTLLCGEAVRNAMWAEIDMDRIPHAELIRAGAAGS